MPKQLPGAWELVMDSWRLFTANWNQTIKISIWLLYFGLAEFAIYLLSIFTPTAGFLLMPLGLAMGVVSIWISIRLMLATLKLADKKSLGDPAADNSRAWDLFLPLVWIGILEFLIVMGGFLLLIIPGIFLSVALSFSQLILVEKDKRGLEALSASRELVKGRWWSTFWRIVLGSIVFGFAILGIQILVLGIFAVLVGPSNFISLMQSENPDPLFSGTISLLSTILQAATLPLFFSYNVKLYRALQKSE
ncbi:hypothetical protein HZC53_05140 [Candidatus Uhrbacteria bacterium]|nr:hypothetical protein [Candidatus Uhrbacteria bacterium]